MLPIKGVGHPTNNTSTEIRDGWPGQHLRHCDSSRHNDDQCHIRNEPYQCFGMMHTYIQTENRQPHISPRHPDDIRYEDATSTQQHTHFLTTAYQPHGPRRYQGEPYKQLDTRQTKSCPYFSTQTAEDCQEEGKKVKNLKEFKTEKIKKDSHGVAIESSTSIQRSLRQHSKGPIHVFNYVDFPDTGIKRDGAESDSKNIKNTFSNLGYDVHIHTNYTLRRTRAKFEELQKDRTLSALVTVILSHGTNRYSFKTSDDRIMDLDKVRQMFTDTACPRLKGKPKIFMANFCRGDFLEYVPEATPTSRYEPPHNMVTIHAATEGIKAIRSPKHGSIFILCLCKILKEHPKWELKRIFNELYRQMTEAGGTTPMWEGFPPMEDFYF
ncbi:unnamed protein product [Meganyctiphanes norvegica]|uniref:Uncharacterized protein n=1 Tax=Meganyctiphanes norvegica TaxID=48144 RepID=A0AAV2SAK1_MEGNR